MTTPASRPLALVTGASSGIGLELARQFAQHGFDLVICAEDAELEAAARALDAEGTSVEAVQADLATPAGVEQLWAATEALGRPLDAIALNAGVGHGDAFVDGPLEADLRIIDLNVRSTVHLAKLAVRQMAARGQGRVLITSSVAAAMPGPYQAVYHASKSFDQAFALSIREELKDTGVTVTSLMPGPTETEFFERGELTDTRLGQGPKDDAADIAKKGFEALMNGDERAEGASLLSKVQGRAARLIPDGVKAAAGAKMAEPGSAKDA